MKYLHDINDFLLIDIYLTMGDKISMIIQLKF